jgi:hypothetical protein
MDLGAISLGLDRFIAEVVPFLNEPAVVAGARRNA